MAAVSAVVLAFVPNALVVGDVSRIGHHESPVNTKKA
jgi:hypothetical protein